MAVCNLARQVRPVAKQIAAEIATAGGLRLSKLGLRFDRVATEIQDHATSVSENAVPAGQTVLLTISAPIRLPGKTTNALTREITALALCGVGGEFTGTLNGNRVRLRLVEASSKSAFRLVGFVHNADQDPERLLNLAEAWLNRAD